MFETPTVFILGAGASWHYNYPTGEDIIQRIIEKTNFIINCFENEIVNGRKWVAPNELPLFFQERFKQTDNQSKEILEFLSNFVDRIHHVDPPVIDYFLEWNKDLQDVGKLIDLLQK